MSPRLVLLALAALPAAVLAAPAPLPRPERRQAFVPPNSLDDLVRIARKGGDVRRGARFLRPKYEELDDLEKAYKPRRRGGVGVGPPSNADGIEYRLIVLQRRAQKRADPVAQRADVLRVAYHVIAITEVARLFAPDRPNHQGKGAKEWGDFADETIRGARDLAAAADAGDAETVRAAARRTFEGCVHCHEVFRE
jgi:hypothetical protein